MTKSEFWDVVETTRAAAKDVPRRKGQDFGDLHEQTLTAALRTLSPKEILDYADWFDHFHDEAYRWDLWAVAYWLHGGCGNDGFSDFRTNLITLGRDAFQRVLKS